MKTSLIRLHKGDPVIYEPEDRHIQMFIKDFKIVPNGINDPKLVCLIVAERNDGFIVEATSDKFIPTDWFEYKSVYDNN